MNEMSNKPSSFERLKQKIMRRSPSVIGNSTGAGTGALVGLGLGGPLGAVGGAAIGSALGGEVEDLLQRALSKQERIRIKILTEYVIKKIENNIATGHRIWDDDFVRDGPISRSSAKEIVEGLYISAKEDHEEKKLFYYGNLLANILFHSDIDRFQANLFIRIFENLSYRQLCIMALIEHKYKFKLRNEDYRPEGPGYDDRLILLEYQKISLLQEIKELHILDLVAMPANVILSIPAIIPAELILQGTGGAIYELAELNDLYRNDYEELERIAGLLK